MTRFRMLTVAALLSSLYGLLSGVWGPFVWAQTDSLTVMQRALADIAYLASPELAGRGYQDEGHLRAAYYLAERMQDAGLIPLRSDSRAHDLRAYFQPFDFPLHRIDSVYVRLGKRDAWQPGIHYIARANCPTVSGTFAVVDGGQGAPESLAHIDCRGKWLLIRDGLEGEYGKDPYRIQLALDKGAAGILLLRSKLTAGLAAKPGPLPIIEATIDAWPAKPGKKPQLTVHVESITLRQSTQNVLGFLPGRVADTAIVIGGHYDHLGRQGTARFVGANDNASGVAFFLSLMDYFSRQAAPPKYSLIFMGFGAEEAGLHGSLYYTQAEPLFPLDQTKVMLNMDLFGSGEHGVMVVAGETYPAWMDQIRKANLRGNKLLMTTVQTRPNAANSDHYPFTLVGIPALFFYLMGQGTAYHDVFDTPEGLTLAGFWPMRQLMIRLIEGQ